MIEFIALLSNSGPFRKTNLLTFVKICQSVISSSLYNGCRCLKDEGIPNKTYIQND